jgi:hypothetical protein
MGVNQAISGKHGTTRIMYLAPDMRQHVDVSEIFVYDYVE